MGLTASQPATRVYLTDRPNIDLWTVEDQRGLDGGANNGVVRSMPYYTRSLDAAWEGAVKTGLFFTITYFTDTGQSCAAFEDEDGCVTDGQSGSMPHPAEALVLACLRAVGVDESELV